MSVAMPRPTMRCWRAAPRSWRRSRIVPGEGVIAAEARDAALRDPTGSPPTASCPMVVVLPETTAQVSARARAIATREGIKVVPRGAGTSLSGGALPLGDGVLLGMAKFNRIREIDFDNRVAVVEPGVTNLAVSQAVEHAGFYYAPDPSSQIACTIGGNVAENSGGVHCLKYGMTTNNVLGCEIGADDRRDRAARRQASRCRRLRSARHRHRLGGPARRRHRGDGAHPEEAGDARAPCWSASRPRRTPANASRSIIGAGIIPGGMEMMDRPAIHAVEEFVHAGYPLDVEALLIVELDGPRAEVDHLIERVEAIAQRMPRGELPRRPIRRRSGCCSGPAARRRSRRSAASRRIIYCMDGTIPRAKLPLVLQRMRELSAAIRACASPTCSMPATATCIRSSSTTPTSRASSNAPRSSAPTSCGCASRSAACSPASTASASRSAT